MKLGVQVRLGPGHIVLDGDPGPPLRKRGGADPQFLAHICWGQMVAGIKMPLDMEVGLDLGGFLLDGYPAIPSIKSSPIFGSC